MLSNYSSNSQTPIMGIVQLKVKSELVQNDDHKSNTWFEYNHRLNAVEYAYTRLIIPPVAGKQNRVTIPETYKATISF